MPLIRRTGWTLVGTSAVSLHSDHGDMKVRVLQIHGPDCDRAALWMRDVVIIVIIMTKKLPDISRAHTVTSNRRFSKFPTVEKTVNNGIQCPNMYLGLLVHARDARAISNFHFLHVPSNPTSHSLSSQLQS